MTDPNRIPLELTRADADELQESIQRDLRAPHNWIGDVLGAGPDHKAKIERRIERLTAIAAKLRAPRGNAGERED